MGERGEIISKVRVEIRIQGISAENSRRGRISFAVGKIGTHCSEVIQPIVTPVRLPTHEDSSYTLILYTKLWHFNDCGFDHGGIIQSRGRRDVALQ